MCIHRTVHADPLRLASLLQVRVMLAGVDSVGIGINPVEGWNSWMILYYVGVIIVGVSLLKSQHMWAWNTK